MFYVKWLTQEIVLDPINFGPRLRSILVRQVKDEVEGNALSNYGYVVSVLSVPNDKMVAGIIEYDTGAVVYKVEYQALLFRPFTNEIMDTVVSQVNALGFFTFVGPLRIFVSKHSMPADLSSGYDGDRDSWISQDGEVEIKRGCGVRLKIIGSTVEENNITSIGSIKDDFLGLIDNGEGGEQ